MSAVQIQHARSLFAHQKYPEALEVYEEIKRFQEVLNKHLGRTVPEYPDVLTQIVRCRTRVLGGPVDVTGYREVVEKYPEATCWVSDSLRMSVDYFLEQESRGSFRPNMAPVLSSSSAKMPAIQEGFTVRIYPWILHAALSPDRLYLGGKYKEEDLDPKTGKKLEQRERKGYVRYFGGVALRSAGGKLALSDIKTGRPLWEVDGDWGHEFLSNGKIAVGNSQGRGQAGKLQMIDLQTGNVLWDVPGARRFQISDRYVTVKRVKQSPRAAAGGLSLEEAAHGDSASTGYIFEVLDPASRQVVFHKESTGTHYWREPVAIENTVLLTDEFAYTVYAYDIPTGKLRWEVNFESFFAAPPTAIDGRIYMYMRRPKHKTIYQYVLDPGTGSILHVTDLQVNSLYTRPMPIGESIYFYDPVAYELISVDRRQGGVTGKRQVTECLSPGSQVEFEVSKRNSVTLESMENSIFIYMWDGLVIRLDVASPK
jgi:outer membrane protein assembly factor BamB